MNQSLFATLTVAGTTSRGAVNATVNGLTATRYVDNTYVKDGFTLVDGTNTFTAVGYDNLYRTNTDTISLYLPATNAVSYDANGNKSETRLGSHLN